MIHAADLAEGLGPFACICPIRIYVCIAWFIAEPRLPASTGPASSAANSAPASPYRAESEPAAAAAHAARALVSYARVDMVLRASCSSAACTQPTQRAAASPHAAVAAATPAASSGSRTWLGLGLGSGWG